MTRSRPASRTVATRASAPDTQEMGSSRRAATVAAIVLALMTCLVAVPATASSTSARRDVATVEGYDYHTLANADVVAGTRGNVVIRYAASRAIRDGVLRVVLPRTSWPTDLRPEDALFEVKPPGAFSVRPGLSVQGDLLTEPTRPIESMCEPVGPATWSVSTVNSAQVLTVRGINCEAGRQLAIRLEDVQAPQRPGSYAVPMVLTSARGLPRISLATMRVVPPPSTRLVVTVPDHLQAGVPFDIVVTAVGADGLPDTDYRGAIAITDPDDCTLVPRGRGVAHQFAPADGGSAIITVELSIIATHQLRVYDVARRAVDGLSAPFEVGGPSPGPLICPVSYH
jgi:hypothetical protein